MPGGVGGDRRGKPRRPYPDFGAYAQGATNMLNLAAVLVAHRDGGEIPICRTRRADIISAVAAAARDDVRAAASNERDPQLSALLHQELDRLDDALELFGIRRVKTLTCPRFMCQFE